MAFKVRKIAFRRWPVAVTTHELDENDQPVEIVQHFIGHFLPFNEDDFLAARREVWGDVDDKALQEKINGSRLVDVARADAARFARLMCGWDKVSDVDGNPIPYSEQVLIEMCTGPEGPAFRAGINLAILELRMGMGPAKNVETSPVPGPRTSAGEAAPTS